MKIKDIAKEYGISQSGFEDYLIKSNVDLKFSITGMILENDIPAHVQRYKEHLEQKKIREVEEAKRIREEYNTKQLALSTMLVTSGYNFEGYKIVKYSGYISGDDAMSIDRGTSGFFSSATNVGQSLIRSLTQIRKQAIKELKEAAYDLGCNAVIGVDFDYITLDPQTATSTGGTAYLPYVFCVTANGTAVVIEKED